MSVCLRFCATELHTVGAKSAILDCRVAAVRTDLEDFWIPFVTLARSVHILITYVEKAAVSRKRYKTKTLFLRANVRKCSTYGLSNNAVSHHLNEWNEWRFLMEKNQRTRRVWQAAYTMSWFLLEIARSVQLHPPSVATSLWLRPHLPTQKSIHVP